MSVASGAGEEVPGPPRGRRWAPPTAEGSESDDPVRSADGGPLASVLGDVAWLVAELAVDPRLPGRARAIGASAVALAAWPRVPIPGPRLLGRGAVAWLGVRYLLRAAGYALVYEHWRGTDEGLALVLALADVKD